MTFNVRALNSKGHNPRLAILCEPSWQNCLAPSKIPRPEPARKKSSALFQLVVQQTVQSISPLLKFFYCCFLFAVTTTNLLSSIRPVATPITVGRGSSCAHENNPKAHEKVNGVSSYHWWTNSCTCANL